MSYHILETLCCLFLLTAQSTKRFKVLRVHYVLKLNSTVLYFCVTFYFKVNLKNLTVLSFAGKKSIPLDIRLVHETEYCLKYSLTHNRKWLKWNLLTFSLLIFITVLSKSFLERSNKF